MTKLNKYGFIGSLILLATTHTLAAPKNPSENCHIEIPDFYDEVYKETHNKIAMYAACTLLNEKLKKPIENKRDCPNWIKGYQVDRICIHGEPDKKTVQALTKAIVMVPAENSDSGKAEFLLIETYATYDPDRNILSIDPGYRTIMTNITDSMIRVFDYYQVFSEKK